MPPVRGFTRYIHLQTGVRGTMTTQSEVIKQSDLLNQLVLNRDTMEELGRIEILWMYIPSNRVLGFVSKSGFLGAKKLAFKLAQVSALGANGVLITAKPEETNAEKVSKLETLIHCEVWSDSGEKVGKIINYIFNLKTGEISKYLFVSSGLGGVTGEIYELAPTQILSLGRRRVLVPDYAIHSFSIYREGIKQKLTKAGEFLMEEKTQVTEELRTLTKRAQKTTEQAKGRLLSLTEQLKDRAQSFAQQARETAQTFNEQLQEEAQILAEQARERSQNLAEQVKEQSQNLSEQVEDGIQTLTVQAREIFDSDDDDQWESPSRSKPEEDPEDYFDALFQEEEEVSAPPPPPMPASAAIATPVTGSSQEAAARRQSMTQPEAIADDPLDPWNTPPDSFSESLPQSAIKEDLFGSPWEEDEKTEPSPPLEPSPPAPEAVKSPPLPDETDDELDDEPWV
ncbi:MAG: PRC-barrel domain-containing protein [Kovacikia sp.]